MSELLSSNPSIYPICSFEALAYRIASSNYRLSVTIWCGNRFDSCGDSHKIRVHNILMAKSRGVAPSHMSPAVSDEIRSSSPPSKTVLDLKRVAQPCPVVNSKKTKFCIDSLMEKEIVTNDRKQTAHEKLSNIDGMGESIARKSTKINNLIINTCGNSKTMAKVTCRLEESDVWLGFHRLGTEMIITKSGRLMFPVIKITFSGFEKDGKYAVLVDIVPVDNKRYRYAYHRSSWLVAGKADPPSSCYPYLHPYSPFTSEQLTRQTVAFDKIKLTNNEHQKCGQIVLNSMHKYQPRIHIVNMTNIGSFDLSTLSSMNELNIEEFKTFIFPQTKFMAVTAYQNHLITKMKIERNPFAKGFRESNRLSEFADPSQFGDSAYNPFPAFGDVSRFVFQLREGPLPYSTILQPQPWRLPCLMPQTFLNQPLSSMIPSHFHMSLQTHEHDNKLEQTSKYCKTANMSHQCQTKAENCNRDLKHQ